MFKIGDRVEVIKFDKPSLEVMMFKLDKERVTIKELNDFIENMKSLGFTCSVEFDAERIVCSR